jgi:hypothetical protein
MGLVDANEDDDGVGSALANSRNRTKRVICSPNDRSSLMCREMDERCRRCDYGVVSSVVDKDLSLVQHYELLVCVVYAQPSL